MPRKVDPRWGDDRVYTHDADFEVDISDFRDLPALAQFTNWDWLKRELQELGVRYGRLGSSK